MQGTRDQERENSSTKGNINDQEEAKGKHIILFKHSKSNYQRSEGEKDHKKRFGSKSFRPFTIFLCRKDVATACFYSTLHLKTPNNWHKRKYWEKSPMKMKKEDHIIVKGQGSISNNKVDSATTTTNHAGNKVLPITDTTLSSSAGTSDQCSSSVILEKEEKIIKGDKIKAMSRMKELLRWAAAVKSEKKGKFLGRKVLQFRNKATLKALPDDDQMSNESPKISFRWEVESCSTITSSCSGISMASSLNMLSLNSTPLHLHDRKGNWITTDSEFVVLEL